MACCLAWTTLSAADPIKIYINPGHGGHDSDDRNVVIPPYAQGDPNGYWESNSNLDKGLRLRDILEAKGYKVTMSRITNTTDDDLDLSTISSLANNSNSDFFFSIHSNATGTASRVNFPLMLFRGYTEQPISPEAKVMAGILDKYLLENQATVWTSTNPNISGDWTFYPSWGTQGLGVLRGLTIPGMLSEGSFHDYIPETYRLMNKDFCWLEAWHFSKAIEEYFSQSGDANGNIVGCVYDSRVLRTDDYIMYGKDKNAPINGASVVLKNSNGETVGTYTCDNLQNGFYAFKNIAPGNYTIKVSKSDTHQDSEMSVVVDANKVAYANIAMNKIRDTAPQVTEYSPVWKTGDSPLLCNTQITMKFNWDMDTKSTEAAFSITPKIDGTFSWLDSNYQLVFTPSVSYQTNTLYTVKLNKSAQHAGGTSMANDFEFQFMTDERGYMTIIGLSPEDNAVVDYKSMTIMLQTDKALNAAPIFDQVTVKDLSGNILAFNKRGLTYGKASEKYGWAKLPLSSNLTAGSEYTLTVSKDMADKDGIIIGTEKTVKFKAEDLRIAKEGAVETETFETPTDFTLNDSQSKDYESASVTSDASAKLFGSACGNFKYTFTGSDGYVTYSLATLGTSTFKSDDKGGIYVNGDMSGNALYLVASNGTETKDIKVCDVNFLGWKYIEFDMNQLSSGVEYKLKDIRLNQSNKLQGMTGAVKLDNFVVYPGKGGVSNVEVSSLTIHPNPASEYIIANGDDLIESLELISNAGATVAKAQGNVINVSEIANGNYLLKVNISGTEVIRKVIVKHN